jgi:hypothetical protein
MTVGVGQFLLHGVHVWQVNGKEVSEPAVYVTDWPSMNAAETKPIILTIESDRDFHLTHITHAQSDAPGFIPLRVQVSDQNGKRLFIQPAYINAVSSQNAGQPYVLPMRRLYRRSAPVKVTFTVDP